MKKTHVLVVAMVAGVLALVQYSDAATTIAPGSIQTAIVDETALSGPDSAQAFARIHDTGATVVRLVLDWRSVAPASPTAAFRAGDPGDAQYNWTNFDQQVTEAAKQGLEPIVDVFGAPPWATARASVGGAYKPNPQKLALFAKAAAERYSGTYQGLPRARYWQLWNEPNLAWQLRPQFIGKTLESPVVYRGMLNAFSDAVHAVHADNSVIAGGTAPFTTRAGKPSSWGPGPLLFMRTLLCLSKKLTPTCHQRAKFDIWGHDPYTAGGPSHHAGIADDVSLGDLPRMRAVLDAGVRAGNVVSRQKVRFWVTEFSWDTNPPDPNAMPLALQTRWISEGLYTMWKAGVSLLTWYLIKDQPVSSSPYQSGLYFVSGKPKPSLRSFRFPFVAFKTASGIDVWGRTPWSKAGTVIVEQQSGGGWARLGIVKTNANGIFLTHYASKRSGPLRARLAGSDPDVSVPFSLTEPPDKSFRPFGEAK